MILKAITRTRTLKGGGFGLTVRQDHRNNTYHLHLVFLECVVETIEVPPET